MKKYLIFIILCSSVILLHAQSKKRNILIGVQVGSQASLPKMNTSIPKFKLGLPSFSYAASIEKRFTIHNRLNFSLEYSLNYLRYAKNFQLETNQNLSSSFSAKNYQVIQNKTQFFTGVGANLPFGPKQRKNINTWNCFPTTDSNFETNLTQRYTPRFNPFVLVGIENSTKIFNKNLVYSLQYNFGFMPLLKLSSMEGAAARDANTNGFRIGLKYKY